MKLNKKCLLVVLFLFCFTQSGLAGFKDYSKKGGEFQILKNIRLKASKVDFVEKRRVGVFGKNYDVSVFLVRATVTIQTEESYVGGVFEKLTSEFELMVGEDKENEIHDKLINQIYALLIENPKEDFVFQDIDLTYKNGSYLIFSGKIYMPELVWSEGKFVQVKFKRFLDKTKNGFGSTQSFWADKIRFYPNGEKLRLRLSMREFKSEFLRLYKEGKFQRQKI
jgi:hypothetical protein